MKIKCFGIGLWLMCSAMVLGGQKWLTFEIHNKKDMQSAYEKIKAKFTNKKYKSAIIVFNFYSGNYYSGLAFWLANKDSWPDFCDFNISQFDTEENIEDEINDIKRKIRILEATSEFDEPAAEEDWCEYAERKPSPRSPDEIYVSKEQHNRKIENLKQDLAEKQADTNYLLNRLLFGSKTDKIKRYQDKKEQEYRKYNRAIINAEKLEGSFCKERWYLFGGKYFECNTIREKAKEFDGMPFFDRYDNNEVILNEGGTEEIKKKISELIGKQTRPLIGFNIYAYNKSSIIKPLLHLLTESHSKTEINNENPQANKNKKYLGIINLTTPKDYLSGNDFRKIECRRTGYWFGGTYFHCDLVKDEDQFSNNIKIIEQEN